MNLVDLINGERIGFMTLNDFKDILLDQNKEVRVKSASNGMVLLNDRTIIKCVSNYYADPTKPQAKKRKLSNACHEVHKSLSLDHVSTNSCRNCHLACISAKSEGRLRRI